MTRPTPGPLLAALSASPRKAAECLVLEARDGTRIGFTTWSSPLDIDLGLGAGVESCARGMNLGSLTLALGLDASFGEASGPLREELSRDAIDGGRWADARFWLVRVSPGVAGISPLLCGKAREVHRSDNAWTMELRNPADALNQTVDRTVVAYCNAELGDARCGYALVPVAATISAVTDALRMTVTYSGSFADGHFNLGRAIFTSGTLDGVTSERIFDFNETAPGTGQLVLWTPLVDVPAIGDTLELKQGCSKLRKSDDATVPTCLSYGNVINFRGFPDAPGRDVLLYPNPGASG